MSDTPLVSAIIIFLDGAQFMREAIASVFAQTYRHWELLLVDDGSRDGSSEIAQQYGALHPECVRYLEHPSHANRGMSASRNLGIKHARGDYVGFLDADDLWLPDKLERQVAILKNNPTAAMVYGRTQIWHRWGEGTSGARPDYFYDLGVEPDSLVMPPSLLLLLIENQYQTPTTCNALVRRSAIDRVGGFDDDFRAMYEDQVFFAKVELHEPVFVAGDCWARYRQHPRSASTVSSLEDYRATRLPFLRWMEQYLVDQGVNDPAVWSVLRREIRKCRLGRLYRLLESVRRRVRHTGWLMHE